jgi:cobalamin biosynthesis Mg chelatase CobN
MFETRQNLAPRRGGHIFALSVLVLLAMCCVPVLAQASSAGYQYSDAPPTVTGGKPPSQSNLSGGSKSTSGIGSPAGSGKSSGAKSSGEGNGSQASSNGSGGGNGAGQQGSQGNGSQQSPAGNANGSPEPGSSGSGSSPLVPILIAIVLLAGGSIAYVMIKRRRVGDPASGDSPGSTDASGSSASPEAS